MAGKYGTSIYEKKVICPKCGKPGYQCISIRYYYPKTDRFGKGRREYKFRVVRHRENGKIRSCTVEKISPDIFKKH
jgi:uncharacterized OB-fold protein